MLLADMEPDLTPDSVLLALRAAAALPAGQRRIAQEVADRPELLTGQGASAALPGVLRFVHALVHAGATTVEPSCPRCGRQRKLGRPFNGLRLCEGCTRKALAMPCGRCGKVRPPARRNDNFTEIFTASDGAVPPELDQLRETLAHVDRPDHALDWLNKSAVRDTLRIVAAAGHTISHEALDVIPPSGTVEHLRSRLVAAGALAARDERLTALERWIDHTIAERTTPEHQRILHGYAVWHHLRRLRTRLHGQPVSHQQAKNVRRHIAEAATFLDWLDSRRLSLTACTQAELDQSQATEPQRAASFVRWAVVHHHASRLTAPASRWTGPAGALDQEQRWTEARRLLHDDACPVADRVAGLLVLLYAQKLNVITA